MLRKWISFLYYSSVSYKSFIYSFYYSI